MILCQVELRHQRHEPPFCRQRALQALVFEHETGVGERDHIAVACDLPAWGADVVSHQDKSVKVPVGHATAERLDFGRDHVAEIIRTNCKKLRQLVQERGSILGEI